MSAERKKANKLNTRFSISLCIGILCISSFSSAVFSDDSTEEPVILTAFDKNSGGMSWSGRIPDVITARTGVAIELIDPSYYPEDKEKLMLTRREYPDLMLIELENIKPFAEAGALLDLSELIETRLPNVKEMYGDTLNQLREEDGSIYYLSNWYGKDTHAVAAFLVRYDYLVELVGQDRADSDEPYSQEEFLELLRGFQKKHPQIQGEDSIPFTVNPENGYQSALMGMFGLKSYAQTEGGLEYNIRTENYQKLVMFLNQMYREGLLEKEWVVNHTNYYNEKLCSGRVFATAGAYWDLETVNDRLQDEYGGTALFYSVKVVGNGIEETETTYTGRNSIGWDAIGISSDCSDLDAAVRLIDFLASEEGQYLQLWGVEGEDWEYSNGIHVPNPKLFVQFQTNKEKTIKETGIRQWTWFIKNGIGSDGSSYDYITDYDKSRTVQTANRRMSSDYWDSAEFQNLEPESGTEEALMYENIASIWEQNFPKMVNAESEEIFWPLYRQTIERMEGEGLKQVEDYISENYQKQKKRWSQGGECDAESASGG